MSFFIVRLSDSLAGADALVLAFAAAVAVAGLFVASLAYFGYRRNESRPMLYLAVGIILLTAVPVCIDYGLNSLTAASDATILLGVVLAHLTGVIAVLYALTKA